MLTEVIGTGNTRDAQQAKDGPEWLATRDGLSLSTCDLWLDIQTCVRVNPQGKQRALCLRELYPVGWLEGCLNHLRYHGRRGTNAGDKTGGDRQTPPKKLSFNRLLLMCAG